MFTAVKLTKYISVPKFLFLYKGKHLLNSSEIRFKFLISQSD